jgi:hypothetical protein
MSSATSSLETASGDPVQNPSHYTQSDHMECIDALRAMLGDPVFNAYCRGHAVRYLWRAPSKGNCIQDLKKARQYIDFALDALGANDG